MAVDIETVSLQGTYRIGFRPPAERSLAAGELYIEVGSGAPKLWVGAMGDAGLVGNMAVFATAEAAPPAAPVNRDVPFVAQEGETLTCTMGNWDGTPDTYAYQWKLDDVDVAGAIPPENYAIVAGDVGKTAVCVVSATNAAGTTAAPPSNQVLIASVGTELTSAGIPIRPEEHNPPPPSVEEQPKPENEPKPHRGR